MLRALAFLGLLFLGLSCQPDQEAAAVSLPLFPLEARLGGEIQGYEAGEDNQLVTVRVMNFQTFEYDRTLARVDSNGRFSMTVLLDHQQDVLVNFYKGYFPMLLAPGDSVHLTLHQDDFSDGGFQLEHIQFAGGDAGINQLLLDYLREKHETVPHGLDTEEMKETKIPDFTPRLLGIMEQQEAFLEDFIQKNEVSDDRFIHWAQHTIKYDILKNFVDYRLFLPMSQRVQPKDFPFPDDYGAFTKLADLQDPTALITSEFARFLDSYYHYVYQEVEKDLKTLDGKKPDMLTRSRALLERVDADHQAFAREALLSLVLVERLKSNTVEDSVKRHLYEDYLLMAEDDYYRSHVSEVYGNLFQDAPGMEALEAEIGGLELPDLIGRTVDQIFADYAGKVIYLDFWATWCAPCVKEFSFYPQIYEAVQTDQVVFVYLANRSPRGHWLKTIEKYGLKGDHYLLNQQEYEVFKELFQIRGIPHHVIIDKSGKVFDGQAPRPVNRSMQLNADLINTLNRLGESS